MTIKNAAVSLNYSNTQFNRLRIIIFIECHETCLTCYAANSNNCLSCQDDYLYLNKMCLQKIHIVPELLELTTPISFNFTLSSDW